LASALSAASHSHGSSNNHNDPERYDSTNSTRYVLYRISTLQDIYSTRYVLYKISTLQDMYNLIT